MNDEMNDETKAALRRFEEQREAMARLREELRVFDDESIHRDPLPSFEDIRALLDTYDAALARYEDMRQHAQDLATRADKAEARVKELETEKIGEPMDPSKPIEEIRNAFHRIHRAACGDERSRGYMSIPADAERDADIIVAVALDELERLRAYVAGEPARLAAAREEQREACVGRTERTCHKTNVEIANRTIEELRATLASLLPGEAKVNKRGVDFAYFGGRAYLSVAGRTVALEGDQSRDFQMGATWTRADIGAVVDEFSAPIIAALKATAAAPTPEPGPPPKRP